MGFLIGFGLFFLAIVLTIIFGGISKLGDKRVMLTGRPTDTSRDSELNVTQRREEIHV